MIGIGVIGYGYWGPNLVRSFSHTPGAQVRAVADLRAERLSAAHAAFPSATTTDPGRLIADTSVDAIVIATDADSHFEFAMAGLRAGKHVLVEKPLAKTKDDAARLVAEATRRQLVLMVDHTFVFTSAVQRIREVVTDGTIGDILFYDGVRTSLHRFHPETGVLWDLAVHDLALIDYLMADPPEAISATGFALEYGQPPDDARITLFFGPRRIAHVHANWLTAVKLRRTTIGGERGTIVYDDLDPFEKVKVYEGGASSVRDAASIEALRIDFRSGGMWAPALPVQEALRVMAAHFVACIETGGRPITDGHSGHRIVSWLEAAQESLSRLGEPVRLA
jgi:predicted dehydrogenase